MASRIRCLSVAMADLALRHEKLQRVRSGLRESRRIKGLRWVEERASGPFDKAKSKRACIRRGNAYEKKVGRALRDKIASGSLSGELNLGQWFLFCDSKGTGWAQPDAFIVGEERILLVEAKLTQTDTATAQLLSLYLPILRKVYGLPVLCLMACKNLNYVPKRLVDSPEALLRSPGPGVFTWHYIGV